MIPRGSLSINRARLGWSPQSAPADGGLPVGSPEAKAAIERVRLALLAEAGVPKAYVVKRPKGGGT